MIEVDIRVQILSREEAAAMMPAAPEELTPGRWLHIFGMDLNAPLDKLCAIDYVADDDEMSPAESIGQSLIEAAEILSAGLPGLKTG